MKSNARNHPGSVAKQPAGRFPLRATHEPGEGLSKKGDTDQKRSSSPRPSPSSPEEGEKCVAVLPAQDRNPLKMSRAGRNTLLRQWSGPLTRDLVQRPGEFGLGSLPSRLQPDATTTVVCGFCSTGCGLSVHLRDGKAINLSAAADYPVNLGMACPKGWEALTPLAAPDRATRPLLRNRETGELEPVDWDEALQVFTLKFKALQDQHGPESIALLSTGQICTEEMAFLGALFKFGMGGLHGDSNTRQCMATSHVAYKQSFGFDAPPYTYADFEESDVLVFIGSNPCIAHPIMWQRVLRNRHRPEILVIDPRKTETAMSATQHLAIAPKSDLVLLYGAARALIERGAVKRPFVDAHTTGFDGFAEFVKRFTPAAVCEATGLSGDDFDKFIAAIARGKAVSFWWTMGVNQGHESTRTAQAIINLALMTGNIGRPGTGAKSITGQCNAMGSRLFANATGLLGGHDFLNPAHREKIATTLGIPVERIPARNSWAYDQIIQGIDDGAIKGLWVVATNTSHSWISKANLPRVLGKLEFLVVQDMYSTTDTARQANLILPAAGWGEKEGTFINSERRFGLAKKVSPAPGQALADFHILQLVAHYWGCDGLFKEWSSPEAVFQILKRCSKGQPCDITGIRDYRMIDESGGVQWPFPETRNAECGTRNEAPAAAGDSALRTPHSAFKERRLFEDGRFYHTDGKAKFLYEQPRAVPEKTDAKYPFVLLSGRGTSAQWHTETRTGKSDILRRLSPESLYVEIHPADAARLGIAANATVRVASRRGTAIATALVTATVQPGQVFMPMHYAGTNELTYPAFDPYSRQPSYKYCAVRIERIH
jgi:anaerobic selenocysteine-containing dehydrogenase